MGKLWLAQVGRLVVLRINVALAVFQPYRDLEIGDNQSLKIQVVRPENEPRTSCSASQELNHLANAAPLTSTDTNLMIYYRQWDCTCTCISHTDMKINENKIWKASPLPCWPIWCSAHISQSVGNSEIVNETIGPNTGYVGEKRTGACDIHNKLMPPLPDFVEELCSLMTSQRTLANRSWFTKWQEMTWVKNPTAAVSMAALCSTDMIYNEQYMVHKVARNDLSEEPNGRCLYGCSVLYWHDLQWTIHGSQSGKKWLEWRTQRPLSL